MVEHLFSLYEALTLHNNANMEYSSIWKKCSARGMRGLVRSLYLYTQEGYVSPTILVLAFRGTECK